MTSLRDVACAALASCALLLGGCRDHGRAAPAPSPSPAAQPSTSAAREQTDDPDHPDHPEEDEESDEEALEEKELTTDQLWRVGVTLVGFGRVATAPGSPEPQTLDCARDAAGQHGECGPKLLRYRQMTPALLTARGAVGWKFARWETRLRLPDGKIVRGRKIPEPFNRVYIDGFPAGDTGETELLTAIFERQASSAFVDGSPAGPAPSVGRDASAP
ncbi:MAG: hypothetical protein NVS3B10_10630 [Polyangiales bacterium]